MYEILEITYIILYYMCVGIILYVGIYFMMDIRVYLLFANISQLFCAIYEFLS